MLHLRNPLRISSQLYRTRALATSAYTYATHGDPSFVISQASKDVPASATGDNIIVKWLAAGVDPVDLAALSGQASASAFTPSSLPAVAGTEGVGIVSAVGPSVQGIQEGDHVIPIKTSLGTWCGSAVVNQTDVIPVPSTVRLELAATLSASPLTALRLLTDYIKLSPGDVIIQDAGSSPVGTAIVQIANALGVQTISLVRESSTDYSPTVERLKLMGADVVIGESYVDTEGFKAVLKDLPAPKLALNGSDTTSCKILSNLLPKGAKMVTYCPGEADSGAIKAKELKHDTFSLPSYMANNSKDDLEESIEQLTTMIENGELTAWLQRVNFDELPAAIKAGGKTKRKLVAMMS